MYAIRRSLFLILFLPGVLVGAGQTSTGQITDSVCAQYHPSQGPGKKSEDADLSTRRGCTLTCVKNGADYVFVSGGKLFQISNQNDPELRKHAGENVKINGTLQGNMLTISSIEAQP
jgi:hypothetical protein